jgi:hypothetical protein
MPAIAIKNVAAGTANALDGLQFQDIPEPGALVSVFVSTAVAGGTIDYRVGTELFIQGGEANIESSADVVDTDRDQILMREPVPAGKQFLSVNAQVCNFLVIIEQLPE